MEPKLTVSFEPGKLEEMIVQFGDSRSKYPYLSLRDYFSDPNRAIAPELNESRHIIAFTYNLPDGPKRAWYFIKTAEVAQKVLNAPRYGSQERGHPWGEGPQTAILRAGLAVDESPGAGTNNVMTTSADKHEVFRKPLREELIKGIGDYIPRISQSIEEWITKNGVASTIDLHSFCRGLVQKTVLSIVGLPDNAVTMEEISKLNGLAHEMAKKVDGAKERMRELRQGIDKRVMEGLKNVKKGTLFWALKQKGYSDLACRETIIALMIGARNGSTALIHLIWLLARDSKTQEAVVKEKPPYLQNLFRSSLVAHSPVRTMNRNAINPMVLKIKDEHGEQCYGIFPGDKVDYLMGEGALPFGVGPNRCPASKFIESIALIAAGKMVEKYKLVCEKGELTVIPNVFVNEFVEEPILVKLEVRKT